MTLDTPASQSRNAPQFPAWEEVTACPWASVARRRATHMTRSSPTCALLLTPMPLLMPLSVPEGLRPLLRTNLAHPWGLSP